VFALRLAEELKAAGANVWIDKLDIEPGQRWDIAVRDALTNCPSTLVILSQSSVDSENVLNELDFALAKRKRIIPVLFTECEVPLQLRRVQYIDFRKDHARGLIELLKALGTERPLASSGTRSNTVGDAPDALGSRSQHEKEYSRSIRTVEDYGPLLLLETGSKIYSSYSPFDQHYPFKWMRIATTPGFETQTRGPSESREKRPRAVSLHVYVLRDPIRPFEIQIGENRAIRYHKWGRGRLLRLPSLSELKAVYPLLVHPENQWLQILLAELTNDPEALEYMAWAAKRGDQVEAEIWQAIARNPSSPTSLQAEECPFCNPEFAEGRRIRQPFSQEAILIANDFPCAPFFDYLIFPREPIHTWEAAEESHIFKMNWLAHRYLQSEFDPKSKTVEGAAGIRLSSSSSARHLVISRRTRSSAEASVSHIYKKLWGMGRDAVNLADHLREICVRCESRGLDYLGSYLKALSRSKMIIWQDDNVALFVPFGQIAIHELQIMVTRPTKTFLDLTEEEVRSISRAEYIATRLYRCLNIHSFNETMLSLPFEETRAKDFRLIFSFVPREVDLGLSELDPLYVVDKQPWETVVEIDRVWPSRKLEDLQASSQA
jgi:hypothetical protein